jgi:hypothetical protein
MPCPLEVTDAVAVENDPLQRKSIRGDESGAPAARERSDEETRHRKKKS